MFLDINKKYIHLKKIYEEMEAFLINNSTPYMFVDNGFDIDIPNNKICISFKYDNKRNYKDILDTYEEHKRE